MAVQRRHIDQQPDNKLRWAACVCAIVVVLLGLSPAHAQNESNWRSELDKPEGREAVLNTLRGSRFFRSLKMQHKECDENSDSRSCEDAVVTTFAFHLNTDGTQGMLTKYWIVTYVDGESDSVPSKSIAIHSKYRADDYNGDWDTTNVASLHFRCRPPADLDVFIAWQNLVKARTDETVAVLMRLDNSEILTRRWTTATSGDISFYGNRIQSLVNSLETATRFRARAETPDGTLLTADFDVSRFRELAPKVLTDCLP